MCRIEELERVAARLGPRRLRQWRLLLSYLEANDWEIRHSEIETVFNVSAPTVRAAIGKMRAAGLPVPYKRVNNDVYGRCRECGACLNVTGIEGEIVRWCGGCGAEYEFVVQGSNGNGKG